MAVLLFCRHTVLKLIMLLDYCKIIYMRKIVSFVALSLIAFLAAFAIMSKPVHADGMIIEPDPYSDRWDFSDEKNQQAFINYDNGMQKMIISVGFDAKDNKDAVWLFPVPSDPNKVAIDVVTSLPSFGGEEITLKARSNLEAVRSSLQMTQIYTIPFLGLSRYSLGSSVVYEGAISSTKSANDSVETDVVVYEHVEKEGISSEIITAKTANGLFDYLKGKGLKIESGSISVLDNYIGKDYSFIASWISAPDKITSTEYQSAQRGVYVTFPTTDIFFPLLPTSVYGSKVVPATIRIIGHVTPKVFQDIKSFTLTSYYMNGSDWYADESLRGFYGENYYDINYTKIDIDAPSKYLTDDLWISNSVPIKTYYSSFVATYPTAVTIILLVVSSILTGILAGWICFKDLRKNIVKLGLIGLSNCLSVFGLIITTMLISSKTEDNNIKPLITELRQKGYYWKRRLATLLFCISTPLLVFGLLIFFSLSDAILGSVSDNTFTPFFAAIVIPIVLVYVLPTVTLIIGLRIKRIKAEDKKLFEKLHFAEYSSWLFLPKDGMKHVFILLFSVLFLIISFMLATIVEYTV